MKWNIPLTTIKYSFIKSPPYSDTSRLVRMFTSNPRIGQRVWTSNQLELERAWLVRFVSKLDSHFPVSLADRALRLNPKPAHAHYLCALWKLQHYSVSTLLSALERKEGLIWSPVSGIFRIHGPRLTAPEVQLTSLRCLFTSVINDLEHLGDLDQNFNASSF